MLPPALVAGGLVLAQPAGAVDAPAGPAPVSASAAQSASEGAPGDNPAEAGALSAPLTLVSPIERSETVAVRPPLGVAAGLALAGGRARLQALRAAAESLPNRRDIRMGAVNAEERLALAAHLYKAVNRPHPPADNGAARAEVRLEARPAAAAGMSHILHSSDLMQMRLQLLRESASLLQLMSSRLLPEDALGAPRGEASGMTPGAAPGTGSAATPEKNRAKSQGAVRIADEPDWGRSAFRATVALPDAGGHGGQRGNAHKNALDELFSGRAGTGMGARRVPTDIGASSLRPGSPSDPGAGFSPHSPADSPLNFPAGGQNGGRGAAALSVTPSGTASASASGQTPASAPSQGETGVVQGLPPGNAAAVSALPGHVPPLQSPSPALSDEVWTQSHWSLAARRLQALFAVQDMLADADADGWLVRAGDLPLLEQTAQLLPDSPSVWLLLAEAQMRHDLPLQSVASCDAALDLDSGLSRARYIRALGHARLQQPALAEADLTVSLARRHGLEPQGEDRARRLRARGAVRMQLRDAAGMCEDFGAACALGDCEGLILVRAQGQCLPSAAVEMRENTPSADGLDSPAAKPEVPPGPQQTGVPLPGGPEKRK